MVTATRLDPDRNSHWSHLAVVASDYRPIASQIGVDLEMPKNGAYGGVSASNNWQPGAVVGTDFDLEIPLDSYSGAAGTRIWAFARCLRAILISSDHQRGID